ncbi:ferrous iron transport protein B [Niveispirillum irakense]|uniref:ferrous iron transport protein B n=1 Tax=Niveispirillum irakense TaxID=34011 RepID=UPI0004202A7B|nr:ferrous iron transport protein B [Niveispirillum irakense]
MATQPLIAIAGMPNSGKSALFNRLTGSRQKVANYAGVTVERKEGSFTTPAGRQCRLLDLPGAYSLRARSPDEAVTRDALLGRLPDIGRPDFLICVADATNLKLHLRFTLEAKALGVPMVLALNMFDIAERRKFTIDPAALSHLLGVPVVSTVAVRGGKLDALLAVIDQYLANPVETSPPADWQEPTTAELRGMNRKAMTLLDQSGIAYGVPPVTTYAIDRVLLHPVFGLLILMGLMFFVFQSVFTWSAWPMDQIDTGFSALGTWLGDLLPDGLLRSFLVDGLVAGIGSVIIFLPQILVLYFFILILEDSGYMARAAFLLDRLMGGVGLHGKSFIPLLSSFACAIPGVMAARTIEHKPDRLTTILLAPLMTCSARLPVYTLLIAAFVPNRDVAGGFSLQGLVMFGLYMAALSSGLLVAFVLKRFVYTEQVDSFVMELPTYKMPSPHNLLFGLIERAKIFLRRAGGIIFVVMVIIWVLSTFGPQGVTDNINQSFAGIIGITLAPLFAPIGFTWQMVIALIPGMAAREVAVAVLGTVYSISADNEEGLASGLAATLQSSWALPAAISFLVWYIFAPQCISTLAVIRRETNSTRFMWATFAYLFVLAYVMSFLAYQVSSALLG